MTTPPKTLSEGLDITAKVIRAATLLDVCDVLTEVLPQIQAMQAQNGVRPIPHHAMLHVLRTAMLKKAREVNPPPPEPEKKEDPK